MIKSDGNTDLRKPSDLKKLLEAYLTIEQKDWLNIIIEEARKQAAEEIFRKEPDELIENARLKADLARSYMEREILQNQLKEASAKTAGLLEELENKMSINRVNRLEFFIIRTTVFQKLKEKYSK